MAGMYLLGCIGIANGMATNAEQQSVSEISAE